MLEEIKTWLSVVALLISSGTFFYAWLTSRAKNNSSEISGIKKAAKEHDRRIQTVESELLHLPTKDNVHKMNVEMAQMQGTISTISAQVASMNLGFGRLETYILNKEKDE